MILIPRYYKAAIASGLVLLGSLVGSCSLAYAASVDKKANNLVANTLTAVNVVVATTANIPKTVDTLGSLSAINNVTVSADTDGRIAQILFKNGQQVAKGMPIVKLDNSQALADYQKSLTDYNLYRTKYHRFSLLGNEAVSKQDLTQLKADMMAKKSEMESKLAALNHKDIVAPFSGVLGAFKVNAGDYVDAGSAIVQLVNTTQLRADFSVPESLLPEMKQGQLIQITVSAYPKKIFYGTVNYIAPTVDAATRTIAIQALVSNPKHLLSPGMFVHVAQQIAVQKNVVVIPDQAVMADVKGYYVYKIVKGDQAVQAYVELGQHLSGKVQVLKGVKAGEVVITAGQQKIQDGSHVQVVKS